MYVTNGPGEATLNIYEETIGDTNVGRFQIVVNRSEMDFNAATRPMRDFCRGITAEPALDFNYKLQEKPKHLDDIINGYQQCIIKIIKYKIPTKKSCNPQVN